jgi:large subunit ribosomal protein L24
MSGVLIKKNDQVLILTGKDRGKRGAVVELVPKKGKVVVEGINIQKRHRRPSGPGKPSGIIESNGPLAISNVMLICPKCGEASRVSKRALADGSIVRACRKCGEVIDE